MRTDLVRRHRAVWRTIDRVVTPLLLTALLLLIGILVLKNCLHWDI